MLLDFVIILFTSGIFAANLKNGGTEMPSKATMTAVGLTVVGVLVALFVAGAINKQFPNANLRP